MNRALFMSICVLFFLVFALACSDDGDGSQIPGDSESSEDTDTSDDGDTAEDGDTDTDESEAEIEDTTCSEAGPCENDLDCPDSCLCVAGECSDATNIRFDLNLGQSRLVYRNDTGRIDIYREDGSLILQGATAYIMLDSFTEEGRRFEIADVENRSAELSECVDNKLGECESIVVTAKSLVGEDSTESFEIIWTISGFPQEGFYTFLVELKNDTAKTLQFAKVGTLTADGETGGGLFIGDDPANHRIWENGTYSVFDFYVGIVPGDVERDGLIAAAAPGDFKGHSASSWNHCVKDLESKRVWIAGSLGYESLSPIFNLSYDQAYSKTATDGRIGFSYFSAEGAYQPNPKPVEAANSFKSELTYVHPTEDNEFDGLENFALKIKKHLDIRLWQERGEGNRIPNGWNSWSTSGSTGGYGTGINEEIILENLDIMANELRDWGIDWFQIDDGYEPIYGDWWWLEDRFPHGPRWLSDQIRERGLIPGLWLAPFSPEFGSQTIEENPDWVAGRSTVGSLFGTGYQFLDLTHPEVKEYLHDLFTTFRNDWGFDWLKMDFSYYALFGDDFHDPTKTREEAYRDGVRIIRDALGDDAFFLAVSAVGAHMGLVDSDRLTLDNMPVWERQPQDTEEGRALQQGFKPTVRSAARRYFLHNRVWINHSDLIVFRSNTRDESWPRVTFSEAQAFCTYVGLTGGIVKLGDRLVDLEPEHIDTIRKLLPAYEKGSRPLDIMEMEFPELWHMHVDYTLDGYDEEYHVAGLFNWGLNYDMTTNPYTRIADDGETHNMELSLERLGLDGQEPFHAWEFWSETYLGMVDDKIDIEVPSHSARVVALRKALDRPQFLGWNRQITMGATDITSIKWDDAANSLTISTKTAKPTEFAPFTYHMAFFVPDSYKFDGADYSGSAVIEQQAEVNDNLLDIRFIPDETGAIVLTLSFSKS